MLNVTMNSQPYFEIVQGEDVVVELEITDPANKFDPFDLSGYTMSARFLGTTGTAVVESVASAVPTSGIAQMTIVAADSATFAQVTRGDWELVLSKTNANRNVILKRGVTVYPPTI